MYILTYLQQFYFKRVLSISGSGKDIGEEASKKFEKGIVSYALPDIGMSVIVTTGIQPEAVGKVQVDEYEQPIG